MKTKLLIAFLLITGTVSAQLYIGQGALFVAGNTQISLLNIDFINDGNFISGSGRVSFYGNSNASVTGSQSSQFFEMEMAKTNNAAVNLQISTGITQRILFTNGFLNLNGFNADLGTTGHLDGETESSRVIGPNGGEVLFNVNLNTPTGSNPANLRLFITSGQDLGNVTIRRGHQSQTTTTGAGSSVLRYYEIAAANNANLNATLRFSYFNGELNNLAESPLVFFEKKSNGNFSNIGFTSRDTVANFVEKAGINSFSRFTLDNTGNPLPVLFVLFNARCEGNSVIIHWKTAQEQNSSRFDIERSTDAIHWTVIGRLPAAGSSSTEKSYSMIDNDPLLNNYYRIAEYDLDSKVQYTGLLRSSCSAADNITVWPNPVHDDNLYINIVAAGKSGAEIKVFDSKGVLVKLQRDTVLQGSNQSRINTSSLPKGTYLISAEWNNGQNKKTIQVIKQ